MLRTVIILLVLSIFVTAQDSKLDSHDAEINLLKARVKQLQLQLLICQDPQVMKTSLDVIEAEKQQNAIQKQETTKVP